jgi:polysaccharide export outer membrane protein
MITLPMIAEIKAAGITRAELQKEITSRYVPKYFVRLNVNVNSDAKYFYVYGEVRRESYYTYPGTMTVLKAIATAGGFGDFAKKTKVELMRANGQRPIVVNCVKAQQDPRLDLPVYPDDRIFVPRRLW